MTERIRPITPYRGLDIVIQPTGKAADALKDAYGIYRPAPHPMGTLTLFEHYGSKTKYDSEQAARDSAMLLAKAWIDNHLSKPAITAPPD